jgi:hypothetical protein
VKKTGNDPDTVLKGLKDELAKFNSGY